MSWLDPAPMFPALRFTLLGYAVQFARPEGLLLVGLALLFGSAAAAFAASRRRRLEALADARTRPLVFPGASALRRGVRGSMASLALGLCAVALARPQCGSRTELARRRGIDLVVAVDASKSMLARDIRPSRIERAKLELSTLLDRLSGDRVAIVAFAGDAFVQSPLTSDYAAAKMFLAAIEVAQMPVGGTNIAAALETARELITEAQRAPSAKVVLLITDGEQTAGESVDRELTQVKAAEIRVYAVGVGSPSGEPIPQYDAKGNFTGYQREPKTNQVVMSRLDEEGLTRIAQATGGRFVASRGGAVGIGEVYEEIQRLQKAEFESRLTVRYADRFELALVPALLLLLVASAIRPARREVAA